MLEPCQRLFQRRQIARLRRRLLRHDHRVHLWRFNRRSGSGLRLARRFRRGFCLGLHGIAVHRAFAQRVDDASLDLPLKRGPQGDMFVILHRRKQ